MGGEVVGYEAITPGEVDYTATLSALASKTPKHYILVVMLRKVLFSPIR